MRSGLVCRLRIFLVRPDRTVALIPDLLRRNRCVHLDQLCYQARPAGLVVGSNASAIIAVEVLVKKQVISPVRVGLEFLHAADIVRLHESELQVDSEPGLGSRFTVYLPV